MLTYRTLFPLILAIALSACSGDGGSSQSTSPPETDVTGSAEEPVVACDATPELLQTASGIEFVRTPDSCFSDLPDFPFEAKYVDIDGLRQAYVEEGPADGEVVLLLHGQPSWSYLYRKMIPVLADAGFRTIAMDHLGLGRSDKPTDIDAYTYLTHNDRLEAFIEALELRDIHLFVQDWGSLIGLRVAGLNPDLFASIGVGDGNLPAIPEGFVPFPAVENPNEVVDLDFIFGAIPDQQEPFYDGCERLMAAGGEGGFGDWMEYAMKAASFRPSEVLEALTWFPLSDEVEAAYDAPYPSREYMAGIRKFPSIVNELGGQNDEALAGLLAFEKPFITIWAANDPGTLGGCEVQQFFIDNVPGAAGQAHTRLAEASHFLQDDQGEEIARRLVAFIEDPAPLTPAAPPEPPVGEEPRVGFEIFEILAPDAVIVWVSGEITRDEFDALELPEGWAKNQPREVDSVGGSFSRSPGAEMEGPLTESVLFGFNWFHNATIVEAGISMDDEGLLNAARVAKHHTVEFPAGSTLVVLIAPTGEQYLRITRDAGRSSDEPTLPAGWRIVEREIDEALSLLLPNPTLNIRVDNQDSFQGPVNVIEPGEIGAAPTQPEPAGPLALSTGLCADPANMDVLLGSGAIEVLMSSGTLNNSQLERMIAAPTDGPFYMVNLIRYRESAVYRDGRETDLTGREANALYSPVEYLSAIGARPVYTTDADQQIEGDDTVWESVAIVEYPCPVAFFAMILDPGFQSRSIHKDAGVEETIIMPSNLQPSTLPEDFEIPESPYAGDENDPPVELIHILNFREIAAYGPDSAEPARSGEEAWAEFESNGADAAAAIGIFPIARLKVQGVLSGDDDGSWDEVHIEYLPSLAAFEALLEDETREAGRYHRTAALDDNYSLIVYPDINEIPGGIAASGSGQPLPVTDLGVGTLCTSDADCAGIGTCLSNGGGVGFCTRACGSGECGSPYQCCHSCSAAVASFLPFSGSACLPADSVDQLTAAPASCTCE